MELRRSRMSPRADSLPSCSCAICGRFTRKLKRRSQGLRGVELDSPAWFFAGSNGSTVQRSTTTGGQQRRPVQWRLEMSIISATRSDRSALNAKRFAALASVYLDNPADALEDVARVPLENLFRLLE